MNKINSIAMLVFLLSACSEEQTSSSPDSETSEIVKVSQLSKFMKQDSVCSIITADAIMKSFDTSLDIKIEPNGYVSKYSKSVTCNYNWKRNDSKEREDKFVSYVVDQMQGKVKKVPMRLRTLEHNFSVRLEEFKGQAEYFMPTKLTEKQLQEQIAKAKKRAAERLTDEQKRIAGNMANSMMENMLRQNNENIKIDGIGDSAYWTAVGGGGLNVLSGHVKMTISPMIGNTIEEDIDNAKNIARIILQ